MINIFLFIILTQYRSIGIIGAMDEEIALIREAMGIEKTDTIAQRIFYIGELSNIPCICVKAGVGKVNAAITTEILISKYNVDAIIFTGVAGGINPEIKIGDVVIAKKVIHHDFGKITPAGFFPFDTTGFFADSLLFEIACKSATGIKFASIPEKLCKEKNRYPRIISGNIATGDQFIADENKRRWIEKTFSVECVEMEGAAVAQVCVINKVPFVIIRSLSDLANENADIDFEEFVKYAARNSILIVQGMFKLLGK
uniref:adenosylhomocysteine nucleosidase n=1 Tax=candidate division WOR-3 bacterium TaxID=2052148 RepID=A0A7V0Z7U9_UNCW3